LTSLPNAEIGILYALAGLVGGSFASAASHRLPLNMPLTVDRSRCPHCNHPLGARDLVPLLSWFAAGGKCRYCGARVSIRYPAIELAMAALFVGAWWLDSNDQLGAVFLALTALGLVIITVADLETRIIPDVALIALLPVAVAWRWHQGGDWIDGIAGVLLGGGLLYGLRAAYKAIRGLDALGLGDIKFVGLAGLYVGATGLAPFLLLGGILGIVFGLLWRLVGRGAVFPFGPALCAALAIMLIAPEWFDALPITARR